MRLLSTLIFILLPFCALSAQNATPKSEERVAIEKLEFLVGHWAGPGTSYADDGSTSSYFDTEDVWFDAQNTLLIIQARGFRDNAQFYGLHTVIYYDTAAGHYWYNPYSARGARRFRCNLDGDAFKCMNEAGDYRLTFQRLPGGEWNEFGERLSGGAWQKNFETILEPVQMPQDVSER